MRIYLKKYSNIIIFNIWIFAGLALLSFSVTATTFITIGDSLTAGLYISAEYSYCPPTDRSYSDRGQAVCVGNGIRNLGGYQPYLAYLLNATTYNHGVSSATSSQIAGLANSVLPNSSVDYVVIMAGTNDVILDIPISAIVDNISDIVELTIQSGSIPIVLTIPPLTGSPYEEKTEQILELNSKLMNTFSHYIVDSYSSLNINWLRNHSGDRVHLNDNGNKLIAEEIASRIDDIKIVYTSDLTNGVLYLLLDE